MHITPAHRHSLEQLQPTTGAIFRLKGCIQSLSVVALTAVNYGFSIRQPALTGRAITLDSPGAWQIAELPKNSPFRSGSQYYPCRPEAGKADIA
jgi:hypothetical protein